jgi:cytochrome c2
MNFAAKSAPALVLLLALSACGGGADDTATPAATDTAAVPADSASPTDGATPTPTATPSETASATPSPTPSASASATTAAATEPAAFAQCKACHSVEPGKNGIGPSLAGIWGEKAGAVPGFEFSDAMKNSGLTWNQATLDRYLTDPKAVVPGNKMAFGGLKDAAKRQDVINYIKSL